MNRIFAKIKNQMKIETIILAGGQSSRMGKDKALLNIDGKTFITHLYNQVTLFSEKVHITTPWQEKYLNLVPQNCHFINELEPHQGPLSALVQSFDYVQTEWVFLVACDMPFIEAKTIMLWQEQLLHLQSETIAFLAQDKLERWQCLCGFYKCSGAQSARQYLQTGKKSFQGWLKTVPVAKIHQNDDRIFYNCNTPEEYQRLLNAQ